jgi:SsrA-binding protein
MAQKQITKNKRAFYDYEITDRFEAGIKLTGAEVKSVKDGGISINEAYIKPIDGSLFLWNSTIDRYKHAYDPDYDVGRMRQLLLKKREIALLTQKLESHRLTIIPLRVYLTRGYVKLEIGLAKGRKTHDKQRRVKKRDQERELHREKRKFMVK